MLKEKVGGWAAADSLNIQNTKDGLTVISGIITVVKENIPDMIDWAKQRVENENLEYKVMNLNLFILLAYVLSENANASSKYFAGCLQGCRCKSNKHGSSAIRNIDCINSHYNRMPSPPPVHAQNKEERVEGIRLILSENRIEHLDVMFLNQWEALEILILRKNKLKSLCI